MCYTHTHTHILHSRKWICSSFHRLAGKTRPNVHYYWKLKVSVVVLPRAASGTGGGGVSLQVLVLCCRCRVPGTYYFVFHASVDDRLCVQMKLGSQKLAIFCDHRRSRRQVCVPGTRNLEPGTWNQEPGTWNLPAAHMGFLPQLWLPRRLLTGLSALPQVTSGGLAVYLAKDEEVWLETASYVGMRASPAGYSIFSGFLLRSH